MDKQIFINTLVLLDTSKLPGKCYCMMANKCFIDRLKRKSLNISDMIYKFNELLVDLQTISNIIIFTTTAQKDLVTELLRTFVPENITLTFSEYEKYLVDNKIGDVNNRLLDKKISHFNISDHYEISEIIPGVYLSGVCCINNINIKTYDLKHVLSVMTNPPLLENVNQKIIPILDTKNQNISSYFEEAYEFIENAVQKNENVIVHCYAGISRSGTIIISYIMRKMNMSYDNAIQYVKSKRSIVSPNIEFYFELSQYSL